MRSFANSPVVDEIVDAAKGVMIMEGAGKFPQYEVPYWGGKVAGWDREEDLVAFQSKHHSDEVRIGITRALGCSPNGAQYWIVHKADLEGALKALTLWAETTVPQ